MFTAWVGAIALIPSFVFFAGIVALIRRVEGDGGWLWLALLLSVVGVYCAAMAIAAVGAVLPFSAAATDKTITKVLSDLLTLGFGFSVVPLVTFFGLVGWIGSAKHGLPAWLGYLAYVVAVVCALGTLGIFVESGPINGGAAARRCGHQAPTGPVVIRRSVTRLRHDWVRVT